MNELMQTDIDSCLATLRNGGIILYPTDTVWGIGCDPTDERAVARLFELKRRPSAKSMLLLADSPATVNRYVAEVSDNALHLMEETEMPLTIIYDGARGIAPELIAADGSIGIRVTSDPFCLRLCGEFGKPIVSTSANISGEPTAASFAEIADEIKAGCDYICTRRRLDSTDCKPSSIVRLNADGSITKIR